MSNLPLIAIVGETASGKTGAAIEIAKQINGEVVSADSWAVYKGFDVGTAKPTDAERQDIPFHLINVVDAKEGFSAAEFKRLALAAIADIHTRGNIPILAGGTGLYVDAVLYDYEFMPAGDPARRQQLDNMSIPELLDIIANAGINADGIDTRNKRRLVRLIESNGERPGHAGLRANSAYYGIRVERDDLRTRIEARVDQMLAAGLEQEVHQLAERYGWDAEPMKGIGYREWQLYFEGTQDLATTRERIVSATANLAKRQRTWFKRNDDIVWFDDPTNIIEQAKSFLGTAR